MTKPTKPRYFKDGDSFQLLGLNKPTRQQQDDFIYGRTQTGINFVRNDVVEIISGKHADQRCRFIMLVELGDDPIYCVELESGSDILVKQSWLRLEEL